MGGEWSILTLESICAPDAAITYGVVKPGPEDSDGVAFIRGGDISNGKILTRQLRTITSDVSTQYKRTLLRGGEILVSLVGNPGQVAIVPSSMKGANIARQVGLVRLQKGIDTRFVKYYLLSPLGQRSLRGYSLGSVQQVINLKDLKRVEIPIPPLKEQKSIAHILGSLDDKIELNRQMNVTLESMAQSLFKSWFVDFDPVIDNALVAGNPIPEPLQTRAESRKALGNKHKPLPEAIQKQFPSRFVLSEEMGWIPEGWEVLPVSQAICINPKVALRKGQKAKYVDMKALPTSGYAIDEVVEKAYSGGAKFCNGDVLLARITPCLENGKTGVVDFLEDNEPGFGSTEFVILRAKGDLGTPFVAALARDENFRKHCVTSMVGSSGRQRVQNSCFDSYCVCTPGSSTIMEEFQGACAPMFEKITALKNKTRIMAILRDTLLPKLLSGQLRIPDAEKLVADAV